MWEDTGGLPAASVQLYPNIAVDWMQAHAATAAAAAAGTEKMYEMRYLARGVLNPKQILHHVRS